MSLNPQNRLFRHHHLLGQFATNKKNRSHTIWQCSKHDQFPLQKLACTFSNSYIIIIICFILISIRSGYKFYPNFYALMSPLQAYLVKMNEWMNKHKHHLWEYDHSTTHSFCRTGSRYSPNLDPARPHPSCRYIVALPQVWLRALVNVWGLLFCHRAQHNNDCLLSSIFYQYSYWIV